MKHLIFALCLIASFAQAQVSQRFAARIYRVGDQLVIADSLGKNQLTYAYSRVQLAATNSLVRVNIDGLSKYYTPPKILSVYGVPYSLTSTTDVVTGILATVPDGTTPTSVTQIGGVRLTDYVANKETTDAKIDVKLGIVANGVFTSSTDSQLQYDGYTWIKKAGFVAGNGGTTKPGPTGFYYERQFNGPIYPEWFGAKAYRTGYFVSKSGNTTTGYYENAGLTVPVVNSGAAIRAANDAAEATSKWVQMGSGIYFADSIFINDGNRFEGVSVGDFGSRSLKDGTSIMQLPGVNRDFLTFKVTYSLGSNRVTGVIMQNFILRGNNGNTIGNGISFRNFNTNRAVDTTHANLNGSHTISNIFIREFPENGMYMRNGGVPAHIHHINCQINGGYGILWEGKQVNRNVTFENIDGDGNKGGAVLKIATTSPNSSFTVRGIRGETKDNATYGTTTGFDRAQPYVVEIGDMNPTSSVHISDVYANAFNTPNKAADAGIFVNVNADINIPFIQWENVVTLPMGGGGAASILYDKFNGIRLDTLRAGTYNRRGYSYGIAGTNNRFVVGGTGKQTRLSIADNTVTARGNYPGTGIYEDDYKGGMVFTQQGGSPVWRLYDSTGASNGFLAISRSALMNPQASFVEWTTSGNGAFRITGGNSSNLDFKDNDAGVDSKIIRIKSNNQGLDFTRYTDANALIDTTLRLSSTGNLTVGNFLYATNVFPKSHAVYDFGSSSVAWHNFYGTGLLSPSGSTLSLNTLGTNSIGMSIAGTKFFHLQPTTGAVVLQSGGTYAPDAINRLQVGGSIITSQYNLSSLNAAPASATATGTLGEIRVTAGFIYVCTATNTWVRAALTTW